MFYKHKAMKYCDRLYEKIDNSFYFYSELYSDVYTPDEHHFAYIYVDHLITKLTIEGKLATLPDPDTDLLMHDFGEDKLDTVVGDRDQIGDDGVHLDPEVRDFYK